MIKAEKLSKNFEDFVALDGLSCTIPSGCIYGMVGTNGAGKSTLLRIITGIYQPTSGKVTINDEPVFENIKIKNKIAFVPDELFFLPGANINRMRDMYKSIYTNFDSERFNYLVNAFGLDQKKNISTFSKGMKRQTAIILALSTRPEYLFLDETFDGLDPVMRNLVKQLICEDVIEKKSTAIITSHSLRELEDTCDQLALLHNGKLVLESDITNIKTSLFKIQTAFTYETSDTLFSEIDILHQKKSGSVYNLIVRGDKDKTIEYIKSKQPAILDVLPLTLEEVFIYETEALGYNFENVVDNIPSTTGGVNNE